ncbi:MAG TPA: TonB-dependent receptor [Polyangiaceae bacterium]|nr:TonB-dependent receptor [Polyangiaceae bacterium]
MLRNPGYHRITHGKPVNLAFHLVVLLYAVSSQAADPAPAANAPQAKRATQQKVTLAARPAQPAAKAAQAAELPPLSDTPAATPAQAGPAQPAPAVPAQAAPTQPAPLQQPGAQPAPGAAQPAQPAPAEAAPMQPGSDLPPLDPTAPGVQPAAPAATPPTTPLDATGAQPPAAAPPAEAAHMEPPPSDMPLDEGAVPPEEEEVVRVTVDRREKDVQDYAGSASAIGQADLDRTGVATVRELSSATPYVHIGTQDGNTEVYIRGVGSNNNTELGDPATATHIDGIYIPRPRGVGSMLYDLERVEVNRGPQGTLRGRNATAGSLNIITAKPKLKEFSSEASVQFGNYAQHLLRGMINIPIGETLALRLAAYGETHDPFYKNGGPTTHLRATEDANVLSYRAGLKWEPSKRVTVLLQHDRTQETGTGWSGSDYARALQSGLLPEEVPDPRAVIFRGPQARMEQVHWGIGGNLTFDLGPVIIDYLGSYRKIDYFQRTAGNSGVNFNGAPPADIDNWSTSWFDTNSKSLIQELRLFAPDKERLRWTVGGFFFQEWQRTGFATVQDKSTGYAGVEYTMPHMVSNSWAGYADATFDILKTLRATAGLRVTTEHKERTGVGYNYNFSNPTGETFRLGTEGFRYGLREGRSDFFPGGQADPNGDYLNGVAAFGVRDTLPRLIQQGAVLDQTQLNRQDGKYDGSFFDWRLGVDTDLTPDNLLYAMFSTAHKSGGFNDQIRLPQNRGSVAPTYNPETLYSTEIGSKNKFLNKKLTVNASGFWYEYRDMQFQVVQQIGAELIPPGGGTPPASAVRFNAARSRVLGLETDASMQLPAGFVAGLGLMLLDSRFTEGVVNDTRLSWDPTQQVKVDLKDRFLTRSPVLSLNYSLSHSFKTSVGMFDWLLHAQTKTKYYMTPFNSEGYDTQGRFAPILSDVVPSFTRFDVAAGWARPEGDVRIDAFINNVTNVTYMTSMIAQPGQNQRFFNAPRQMGVRLSLYL